MEKPSIGTIVDAPQLGGAARDATDRLRKLQRIVEFSMDLSGEPTAIFSKVATMIGELFAVRAVAVAELSGEQLFFSAMYADGQVRQDVGNCPIETTPCAHVVSSRALQVFDRVQERFPHATLLRAFDAEAYCGFPSIDARGNVVAVTCLIDDKVRDYDDEDRQLLLLIANRIANEIERSKAIAARERAERAEHEARLRLQNTLDSMFSFIGMYSLDGVFLDANRAPFESGSVRREDAIGKHFWDTPFFASLPQSQQQVRYMIERAAKGEIVREDLPATVLGDVVSIFDAAFAPMYDADNNITGVVASGVDVTQRKHMEAELLRLNDELEARVLERTAKLESANKALETFNYSVSHDLKAPLRGIAGYSQLLLNEYADKLDESGERYLHMVRAAALQMDDLINDLLTYSRLERANMQRSRVPLRGLIDELLTERDGDVRALHAVVSINVRQNVALSCDRPGLSMVLRNLLDNALKFSRGATPPELDIGAEEHDNAWRIWVRDNGIGFDMRYHNKIFDIFQRLNRAEDYPGTGVGLAIVRKAIERMEGRVWAESAPGKGAAFNVEIPK